MKEISLPESDQHMAMIVRDAIKHGEPITITQKGRPILDLIPREKSWAKFHQTSPSERAAAGREIEMVRSRVGGKLSIQEIISAKHEGHRH